MPKNSLENFDSLGVDDYVNLVRKTWASFHGRRTTLDYALHLFDHASKLGEAIRKDELNKIFDELAELTNWLFGFVAKLNDRKSDWQAVFNIEAKFSNMIWAKYPGICGHCLERDYLAKGKQPPKNIHRQHKKCACLVNYPEVEYRDDKEELKRERRTFAEETRDKRPNTLASMEKMFHEIYEANVSVWTIESIGFHLLEEVGEVGRSLIDLYTIKKSNNQSSASNGANEGNLCDEIAETFSWICSLTAKLSQLFRPIDAYYKSIVKAEGVELSLAQTIHLEWALWHKYRDSTTNRYRCPYCGHSPCTCLEDKKIGFAWEATPK